MVALFVELGVTIRAHQKIGSNLVMADRADLPLLDILEHRFPCQLPLVFFGEGFTGAENHIEQKTGQVKDKNEGYGEDLCKDIA